MTVSQAPVLPELSESYSVTSEMRDSYRRDGHILLRGVASRAELDIYGPAICEHILPHQSTRQPLEQRDTYGKAFLQIGGLWERDEVVRKYVLARRFGQIAADLMGVDCVRLWHDQALMKEPHGGHTPWHQDQYYWPLDTVNTITLWMPLVDVPIEMGALTFASGSNVDGCLTQLAISDTSESYYDDLVRDRGFPISQQALSAGDATFHSGWTLHRAPENQTDRMRAVMTVIYFEDGVKVGTPANKNQENDLRAFLPGLKPGDIAATQMNPVVFQR